MTFAAPGSCRAGPAFPVQMSAATLEAHSEGRENNFDVLRLGAATAVLLSHSFVVTGSAEPLIGHWPLGTLGVEVFFAISGFLIAMSWSTAPGPSQLLRAAGAADHAGADRHGDGLRLPARAAGHDRFALRLRQRRDYPRIRDRQRGAVGTAGVAHHVALDLPGVFESNPDRSVNRSLWTLPIEAEAYAILALIGLAGADDRVAGARRRAGSSSSRWRPPAVTDLPLIGSPLDFLRGADGLTAHFVALFFTAAPALPLPLEDPAAPRPRPRSRWGRWSSRWEHPRSGPCC